MAKFDDFAAGLLDEAKRFLEISKVKENGENIPYLHAAVMVGFCALEAEVNSVCEEMSKVSGLSVHEVSLLLEREVKLYDGIFILTKNLKMFRLEDRIEFLVKKFSTINLDKQSTWWNDLKSATAIRNKLTHPKDVTDISDASVSKALEAIILTVDVVYRAVYKKAYPALGMGLGSTLNF